MVHRLRKAAIAAGFTLVVAATAGTALARIVAVHFDELSLCNAGGWIVLSINEECGTVESTILCDGG